MASMDAQAIYDNFHTHAEGTPGLTTAQQAAEQLAAKYQDRAVSTQQLIDGVQTGWKGAASEAAAQGLTPLAVSSLDTGGQLSTGHGIVGQQVDSFHTAVSEVQPVPPAPQMSNVIAAAATGQDTTPMIDQISHSYTVQASNVVAYSKYVSASQDNTSSLPPITPVDAPAAPVSITTPPPPATSAPTGGAHRAPTASGGAASRTNAARATGTGASGSDSSSWPPPAGSGGSPTPPSGPGSSGSTTISSATPPVASPPSQSSPTGPGGGSGPGQNPPLGPGGSPGGGSPWPGGGPISGPSGDGENIGTGPGSRNGLGPINEDAGGLGGLRSGTGGPGGRMAFGTNSGAGGAGGASGEQGPGSRSGAGAGSAGAAEEEALAAERGAGPGGMGTAGAMGAGRGRGGEDSEHHRKIGVEEDGEELFGLNETVMPPVVGENRAEREQRYAEEESRHGEL